MFEKGKWYKNSDWANDNDYAKACETSSTCLRLLECIHNGKYNKKSETDVWRSKNAVEALLEEVSPYLPDGHPDKLSSWAVKVTEENRQVASQWRGVPLNIGQYTGMYSGMYKKNHLTKEHSNNMGGYRREVTTEEFYRIIGHKHLILDDSCSLSLDNLDNWCIKVTEENQEVASKWRGVELFVGYYTGMYKTYSYSKPSKQHSLSSTGFGKEITTEEFYKKIGHIDEFVGWGVEVTEENREVASKWRGSKLVVGQYTGRYDNDTRKNHSDSTRFFKKLITTEEFYTKIGYVKPFVLEKVSIDTPKINTLLPYQWIKCIFPYGACKSGEYYQSREKSETPDLYDVHGTCIGKFYIWQIDENFLLMPLDFNPKIRTNPYTFKVESDTTSDASSTRSEIKLFTYQPINKTKEKDVIKVTLNKPKKLKIKFVS
jgi:hypothetical protein